jgi:hypothetical protein
MGPDYLRIRQARQVEVVRAQRVSAEESARNSAEIGRELRASEERRRIDASEQADAAREFESWAQSNPEKIEEYQPGWSDYVTDGLAAGEKVADGVMSVLGQLTGPFGKLGARAYTVTKETVKGASEGVAMYARGKEGCFTEGASVIFERAGIGFGKGCGKVAVSQLAGKAMDGVARLAGRTVPVAPDLGNASVVSVIRDAVTGADGGVTRRTVGITLSKRWAAKKITPL